MGSMHLIYSLLYILAHIIILPQQYLKRPRSIRGRWLREKLGGLSGPVRDARGKTLWVHAVSVGEVIAASSFVSTFRARHPEYQFLISTVTDTGQSVAQERMGNVARIIYLPFDILFIFRRAIRLHRPTMFVNMETELWPNMFRAMHEAGVPIVLLNGRISDKSFRGYKRISFYLKGLFKKVSLFCMQDEVYAQRIVLLGAEENRVTITGSLKFDLKVRDEHLEWAQEFASHGMVLVAGSTHRGEEELLADVYAKLSGQVQGLRMIIAPRHPQRADEVASMLETKGVRFKRRSEMDSGSRMDAPVILLDTVGELSSVYRVADLVVMGGSFIPHGGQNPLEPAYWGKTVLCGPSMWNFPFVKEFYELGAVLKTDKEDLYHDLLELSKDASKRDAVGKKARELMIKNQGATEHALGEIEKRIGV